MFTPIVNNKKYFADEVLKVLQENGSQEEILLIKKLITQHIDGKSIDSQRGYNEFIEKVLLNKAANSISIISFNFDYLLNDYYENEIDNGVYFDYLLEFDCVLKSGYLHKNPIPLIKLHGSLDWGLCSKCKKLRLYFPHMVNRDYFGPVCHVGKCDGIIEPYIFLPHQKFDKRISILWNRAKEVLRNAGKVTVIGYAFPAYDQKAIELFQDSLSSTVELEVVDYCEKNEIVTVQQKYQGMFPQVKNGINIWGGGFKQYLDNYNN